MPSRRCCGLLGFSALSLALATGRMAAAASPMREVPSLIVVNHSGAGLLDIRTMLGNAWSDNRLDAPLAPGGRVEIRPASGSCDAKVKVVFDGGHSRVFDVDLCTDGELVVGIDIPDQPGKRAASPDGKANVVVPGRKPPPLDDGQSSASPGKPHGTGNHRHELYRL